MIFDLFIGENASLARDPDAWDFGLEESDVMEKIERVLGNTGLSSGDELTIKIRPAEE